MFPQRAVLKRKLRQATLSEMFAGNKKQVQTVDITNGVEPGQKEAPTSEKTTCNESPSFQTSQSAGTSDTMADPESRISFLGPELSSFRGSENDKFYFPPVKPSSAHTVMIKLETVTSDSVPIPYPDVPRDVWDEDHVRMPCSSKSLYPIEDPSTNEPKLEKRWDLVTQALLGPMSNSVDLEEAIMKYNTRYAGKWRFAGLHQFFTEVLGSEESTSFFQETLPQMIRLVLRLPELCRQPIPLLKRKLSHTLTLSQEQIACLLVNAFFCTYPRRNAPTKKAKATEFATYPDINFNRIFGSRRMSAPKLRCLIHYFTRVTRSMPCGLVSFTRQHLSTLPDWESSSATLNRLHVSSKGTIEDFGTGMMQADFANKFVGGGVLGEGCVQEEIRFLICPELIISRLFTEGLEDDECLIIIGAERYSYYTGYAETFEWLGDFCDTTARDAFGRRMTEIVAMDAKYYSSESVQYQPRMILRELNKAFCSFTRPELKSQRLTAVATGNWGCGAFRGNKELKSLIQVLAACLAGRDVVYFTFGDAPFMHSLHSLHQDLLQAGMTAGRLYSLLCSYGEETQNGLAEGSKSKLSVFDFVRAFLTAKTSSEPAMSRDHSNASETDLRPSSAPLAVFDGLAPGQERDPDADLFT